MTILIMKSEANSNLYFTLDREIEGVATMEVTSDYALNKIIIELPAPTISNERYTQFQVSNDVFQSLNDGLYTYQLHDGFGKLEEGSVKIQLNDFGDNTDLIEADEDGDDFIVVED